MMSFLMTRCAVICRRYGCVVGMVIFIFSCRFSYSQNAVLKVLFQDSRDSSHYVSVGQYTLSKGSKVIKSDEGGDEVVYDSLLAGEYVLKYRNIFRQDVTQTILVKEGYNRVVIHVDSVLSSARDVLRIDQLKEGDSLKIVYSSAGCFHSMTDTLVIRRKWGQYNLTYGDVTRFMDSSELEVVRSFERGLGHIRQGGCTTTDWYVVTFSGKKEKFTDGTCQWRGWYYLKVGLGLTQPRE